MSNAKQELLFALRGKAPVKCASISKVCFDWESVIDSLAKDVVLKLNYSESDYAQFLEELDFEYDSGYGAQYLYGTVWLADGTWLSRGEYDGSEWWGYSILPDIPEECQ